MRKIALLIAIFLIPCVSWAGLLGNNASAAPSVQNKQQFMGLPVYIQIFKEERTLELWVKSGEKYELMRSYNICNYSGGLGPKRRQGDFKSPEGFYNVGRNQLKPDSRFYKAINIGFPNQYDREHGYDGKYLMIHGACVSVGCYAMTDGGIDEIFQFVTGALVFGQSRVPVSIYPFRMTDANMKRHQRSYYADFWQQLKPGYDYFMAHKEPPVVSVQNGQYVVNTRPTSQSGGLLQQPQLASNYTFTQAK